MRLSQSSGLKLELFIDMCATIREKQLLAMEILYIRLLRQCSFNMYEKKSAPVKDQKLKQRLVQK